MAQRPKLICEPEVYSKKEKSNKVIGKAAVGLSAMVFWEFITHFRKAVDGSVPTQSEKHTRLIPAMQNLSKL